MNRSAAPPVSLVSALSRLIPACPKASVSSMTAESESAPYELQVAGAAHAEQNDKDER